jgi:hypothetical protein
MITTALAGTPKLAHTTDARGGDVVVLENSSTFRNKQTRHPTKMVVKTIPITQQYGNARPNKLGRIKWRGMKKSFETINWTNQMAQNPAMKTEIGPTMLCAIAIAI